MSNVAKVIAEQVGAMAFTMLGAKNILAGESSLQFKIGKNAKKITNVVINLMADDTYSVQFWKIRGVDCKLFTTVYGVYADQLRTVIEDNTGMYTSL